MIGQVPRIEVAVTRGCGVSWSLLRRDAAGPADWPVGSRLWLTCQLDDDDVEVEAAIVGPRATIRLTPELCDRTRSSTRLQIVLLTPGGDRRPIATGRFRRDDGGSAMPTPTWGDCLPLDEDTEAVVVIEGPAGLAVTGWRWCDQAGNPLPDGQTGEWMQWVNPLGQPVGPPILLMVEAIVDGGQL